MNKKNKNSSNNKQNISLNRNSSEEDYYEKSISLESSISEIEEYGVDPDNIGDEDYEEIEEQGIAADDEDHDDDDEILEYEEDEDLLDYHKEKLSAEIEAENNSPTHSDYNTDNDAFHLDILRNSIDDIPVIPKKYKNGTRKSLTFTNPQMREIERQNRILLQKILSKGPSYSNSSFSKQNLKQNVATTRVTSAAINRKKQQRQIDMYNQILKRKIDEIGSRRKQFY